MASRPKRADEHLSMIGGYLFGALVVPALALVCLVPIAILLFFVLYWFSFYLAVVVVLAISLAAPERYVRAAHRAYIERGRIPPLSLVGYFVTGVLLTCGVRYLSTAFAHADSGLSSVTELAYIGCSLHLGILWGAIVSREAAARGTVDPGTTLSYSPESNSVVTRRHVPGTVDPGAVDLATATAYPHWGYVVGGISAAVFTFLSTLSALTGGWAGVLEWLGLEFVVIFLMVILVVQLQPPGNRSRG